MSIFFLIFATFVQIKAAHGLFNHAIIYRPVQPIEKMTRCSWPLSKISEFALRPMVFVIISYKTIHAVATPISATPN